MGERAFLLRKWATAVLAPLPLTLCNFNLAVGAVMFARALFPVARSSRALLAFLRQKLDCVIRPGSPCARALFL